MAPKSNEQDRVEIVGETPADALVAVSADALDLDGDRVTRFVEKPPGDGGFINGGFFVLEPNVIDLIEGDDTAWEGGPLQQLARMDQLNAYRHRGFWQPMDTLRDKNALEELWQSGSAPWRVWA